MLRTACQILSLFLLFSLLGACNRATTVEQSKNDATLSATPDAPDSTATLPSPQLKTATSTATTDNLVAPTVESIAPSMATPTTLMGGTPSPTLLAPLIHIVMEGETVSNIAARYYGNAPNGIEIVISANNITEPDQISIGDHLTIPRDIPEFSIPPPLPTVAVAYRPATVYQVRLNDTLVVLASAYGVTPQMIIDANGGSVALREGQLLTIPHNVACRADLTLHPNKVTEVTYQENDQLICLTTNNPKFAEAVSAEISLLTVYNNNINRQDINLCKDDLQPGDILYVPPQTGVLYEVAHPTNILTLVEYYYGLSDKLYEVENWEGEKLYTPQTISIEDAETGDLPTGTRLFFPHAFTYRYPFQQARCVNNILAPIEPSATPILPTLPPTETTPLPTLLPETTKIIPTPDLTLIPFPTPTPTATPKPTPSSIPDFHSVKLTVPEGAFRTSFNPWGNHLPEYDTGICELKAGHGWNPKLAWPMTGTIEKKFSIHHSGLDIGSSIGTPVRAAQTGVVIWAGFSTSGLGNLVALAHGDGRHTYYGHLDTVAANVTCGTTIAKGQQIGTNGDSMTSYPHLHFMVRRYNYVEDPLRYLPPR